MPLPLTGAGPSSGLVTPSSLSNLTLWLKADAGTDTVVNNAAVGTWADQSGNSRDVTAAAAARPLYKTGAVNGKPALDFDGIQQFMTKIALADLGGTGLTYMAVAKLTAAGSFPQILSWPQGRYELRANAATGRPEFSHPAAAATSAASIVAGGFKYLTGTFNDSADAVAMFVNGAADGTATDATAFNTLGNIGIGARSDGTLFWAGQIAEIIAYNRALSTGERQSIESYLAAKYAL